MIKWNLNRIMAEKRKSGRWLAEQLGVHPNTIYRLKKSDDMPWLNGEMLGGICKYLECSPCDLIEYVPFADS